MDEREVVAGGGGVDEGGYKGKGVGWFGVDGGDGGGEGFYAFSVVVRRWVSCWVGRTFFLSRRTFPLIEMSV